METMLASAFGRQVDIQRGEADELIKAAEYVFEQLKEGQLSRDALVVITSEFFCHDILTDKLYYLLYYNNYY